MTEDYPVFTTKYEADLWKAIARAEKQPKKERREKMISNVLRRVETGKGPVSSPILCKLIRIVSEVEADGWQQDIADLVDKQKEGEVRPTLTAASVMANRTFLAESYKFLNNANAASDVATFNRVRAEVLYTAGKMDEAFRCIVTSLRSDPLNEKSYEIVTKIKGGNNWQPLCAIERMVAGLPYTAPADDNDSIEMSLFRIYREWYEGDREVANRMLVNSEGYRAGDADFLLLSARMTAMRGEYTNARSIYEKVAEVLSDDVCVLCESAGSFLLGDDPDPSAAMSRFRDAERIDPSNPRVARGLVRTYLAMGKSAEAMEVLNLFLATEYAEKDDYNHASAVLADMGLWTEAVELADRIIITYPQDSPSYIIKSRGSINEGDISTAVSHAKTAVRCDRKSAEAHAQLSRAYLLMRHVNSAAREAHKAMSIDDGSLVVLRAMLDTCRETGDGEATVEVCRKIIVLDPEDETALDILRNAQMEDMVRESAESEVTIEAADAKEFMVLTRKLLAEGRCTEVERMCRENVDRFGNSPEFRRIKGNAEYGIGEYVKASASFASAAAMNPDSAEIWHSKGLADEGFHDLESALEAYNRAVLLDMKNPHYWISRGCVLQAKGDDVGAVESFNRAIEIDQTAPYPLVRKAVILSNYGRYADALVFMDMAESADPRNNSIKRMKMKMCLLSGRYTDAADIGKNLVASDDDPETIADLARAEMELGNPTAARDRVERALSDHVGDIHLLVAARDIYMRLDDHESLVETCHRINTQNPYDRETTKILADELMKEGRGDEASVLYENLNRAPPAPEEKKDEEKVTDAESIFDIAQSMLKVGDLNGSGRNADKLLELDPDNEDYILFRSRVFEKAGDVLAAESFLKDYLRQNPDSVRVTEAFGDLKAAQGDHSEAVSRYTKCLESVNPQNNPGYRARLLVKLARSQETMRARPAAIRSYSEAIQLNPKDTDSARVLTQLLLMSGDKNSALNVIRGTLNIEENSANYAVLAQVCQMRKDTEGVKDAYRGFLRFENHTPEDTMRVITALNSVGLHEEAESLRSHSESVRHTETRDSDSGVTPAVKRCAERLMRRAYMQGTDINNPLIRDNTDVDSDLAAAALEYLKDIPNYGEIITELPEFARMEGLTYNIIAAPRSRGLENVTVETAYVAGHAKDADEAKLLVGYIEAAKVADIMPDKIDPSLMRAAAGYTKAVPVPQIMKDCRCGIMAARMIQSCISQ